MIDRLTNTLLSMAKKNKYAYLIGRCIRGLSSDDYYKLIRCRYEKTYGGATILFEHGGDKYPDKIIYIISFGDNRTLANVGFFALMRTMLSMLYFAGQMGFIPVVRWSSNIVYFDKDYSKTNNVFEYYFLPVSEIPFENAALSCTYIRGALLDGYFYIPDSSSNYDISDRELEVLSSAFRKYIHLNADTRAFLEETIKRVLPVDNSVLGVHIRGTDFNQGLAGHPIPVRPNEYLDEVKRLFATGRYNFVFLATEDQNVLDLFKGAFGERLRYFGDELRSSSEVSPHVMESNRPLHHYKLGLEVLRDAYTLAFCTGFVGGLSNVSLAARYIARANNREFIDEIILNHGVRTNGRRTLKH